MDDSNILDGVVIGIAAGVTSGLIIAALFRLNRHFVRREQLASIANIIWKAFFHMLLDEIYPPSEEDEEEDGDTIEYTELSKEEKKVVNHFVETVFWKFLVRDLEIYLKHRTSHLHYDELTQLHEAFRDARMSIGDPADMDEDSERYRVRSDIVRRAYEKFARIKSLDLPPNVVWNISDMSQSPMRRWLLRVNLHRKFALNWLYRHYPT